MQGRYEEMRAASPLPGPKPGLNLNYRQQYIPDAKSWARRTGRLFYKLGYFVGRVWFFASASSIAFSASGAIMR
jgi:hypothetical protein